MIHGYTGTRTLDAPGRERRIEKALQQECWSARRVITGGCEGVDAFVGRWYAEFMPDTPQLVLVPSDTSHVDPWWLEHADLWAGNLIEVYYDVGPYMKRNDLIVAESDTLTAFPAQPDERLRSGTWATVRRARKSGVPVDVVPLG